jgi:acetyltransferase-like isoleucine patch superfamily enzyme
VLIERSRLPISKMLSIGLLPSRLKIAYYRAKGARIGTGVKLGLGSIIFAKGGLEIGDNTSVGKFSIIDGSRVRIGKRTVVRSFVVIDAQEIIIGDDVVISETALIRTSVPSSKSKIVIGDRAHIFPFTMIDPTREVEIGEESSVGYSTYIFTHGAYKSILNGYPVEFGKVSIGKRVWIPCKVFITPSVSIGDDAVIGTGALVNRDIPSGVLAVGEPARPIKTKSEFVSIYSDAEKIKILQEILSEFCEYIHDFGQIDWNFEEKNGCLLWEINSPNGNVRFDLELVCSPSKANDRRASVILQSLPEHLQSSWNNERKIWFSIDSHCCSEYLNEFGLELREYFKRYGIYFRRP